MIKLAPVAGTSTALGVLGHTGRLPQVAALAGIVWGGADWSAYAIVVSFGYAVLILSFLGGIWWGLALRSETPARLAGLATVPSLIALTVIVATLAAGKAGIPSERYYLWAHLALGAALLATLPVDAWLERTGAAPAGWIRLRVTLSLGLALLTVAAGLVYSATTLTVTYI